MLYDVHVRGRRGPGDCGDVVGCKPAGCETGGVFPIIVLLEEEVARLEAMIMDGTQEGLLENATVNLSIHDALDAVQASNPLGCDAAPDHETPSSMFDCLLHIPVQEFLPNPSAAPLPPI